jgi:mannitol-specific phosphotransferase system IIBC component
MIWIVIASGTVLAAAGAVTASASLLRSKLLAASIGIEAAVIVLFVTTAVVLGSSKATPDDTFSHEQLEADRVMTEQMATAVGTAMDAQMSTNGMLERSADAAYLRALERHTYQVDRMIGRVP